MRKYFNVFFVTFVFFTSSMFSADYAVVFVHQGKSIIPRYSEIAIRQAAFFNPTADIYIISNRASMAFLRSCSFPKNVKVVPEKSLNRDFLYINFKRKFKDAKENLDYFCFQRFLSLNALVAKMDLKRIFYLEYDVMVYTDLSRFLDFFDKCYAGMAVTPMAHNIVVCGLVYFKDAKATNHLSNWIISNYKPPELDMVFYAKYLCENSDKCSTLPVIPSSFFDLEQPDRPIDSPQKYSANVEFFNSVFDPAPFGQYLGGSFDKGPGFVNPCSCFDASKLHYSWEHDSVGRKVPFLKSGIEKLQINCLHIHSKKVNLFKSY